MFALPGGVAGQFDHVFQMGRLDNAQSCLSPGVRTDRGDIGGTSTGDKNDSMVSLAARHVVSQNLLVNWCSAAERQC